MRKTILILVVITAAVIIVFSLFYKRDEQTPESYFPSTPTQADRDAARKLPQSQCSCWVAIGSDPGCHPQQDCI